MPKYKVTLEYIASFTQVVDANDEGEAYDKCRTLAEDSDMNQFMLGMERESQCECVSH